MKKRVAIVVFFCLGLAGCSGTTFLYNRLHIVLPWMLGSYVDLDREQKDYLKAELKPFLYWHRMEELPRYVQIIDQMEASLDEQVTPEEMAAIVRSFEEAWARLEGRGLELMMGLGERLSDEQMQDFLDSLDELQVDVGIASWPHGQVQADQNFPQQTQLAGDPFELLRRRPQS